MPPRLTDRAAARKTDETQPTAASHGRKAPPVPLDLAAAPQAQLIVTMTVPQLADLMREVVAETREPKSEWMERIECADWLRISLPHLDRLCREGVIPYSYLGDTRRFNRSDVRDAVRARRTKLTTAKSEGGS